MSVSVFFLCMPFGVGQTQTIPLFSILSSFKRRHTVLTGEKKRKKKGTTTPPACPPRPFPRKEGREDAAQAGAAGVHRVLQAWSPGTMLLLFWGEGGRLARVWWGLRAPQRGVARF